jgi:hypothetical protein
MKGFSKGKEIGTNTVISDISSLKVAKNSPLVLELLR